MSERLRLHPKYHEAIELAQLTTRQRYVLDHWLDGHSIRRIALSLGVSESTTRGHFDAAIRKLRPFITQEAA